MDRVAFNAHILETGTQSYRLRTTKTTSRSRTPANRQPRAAEINADQGNKSLDDTQK
jgi:hypothetical protein